MPPLSSEVILHFPLHVACMPFTASCLVIWGALLASNAAAAVTHIGVLEGSQASMSACAALGPFTIAQASQHASPWQPFTHLAQP